MTYIEKFKAMFLSRRFQATVVSVLTVVFQDVLGFTLDQAVMVVGILQSWVIGDSLSKTGK